VRREWLALFAIVLTLGRGAIREVEKSAAREIRQRIGDGAFTVKIEPDGIDGLAQGRLKTLTVDARDFTLDGLPFTLEPERPRSGRIKQFIMRMTNASLRGLRAERAIAVIPEVYYDKSLAIRKRIFRLSATGIGACEIVVNETDLAAYILRKYAPYIREVSVQITAEQTTRAGCRRAVCGRGALQSCWQARPARRTLPRPRRDAYRNRGRAPARRIGEPAAPVPEPHHRHRARLGAVRRLSHRHGV
jgi:hypothetical protein